MRLQELNTQQAIPCPGRPRMVFVALLPCVVSGALSSLCRLSHPVEEDMQTWVTANLDQLPLPYAIQDPTQVRFTADRAQPATIIHDREPL